MNQLFGLGRRVQCLVTRTLNKQESLLKIVKGLESVLMRVQEIPIRKHILSMQDFIQFFG